MSSASIRWRGGTLAFASAHGDVVRVTPAARLAEGAGCWTAEELLTGAAAASYALAVVEAAERDDLPLIDATLETECSVTPEGVECLRIDAALETLAGYENAVRALATAQRAAVPDALAVPVEIRLHVHASEFLATRRALTSVA